jgi:hypothetical protein
MVASEPFGEPAEENKKRRVHDRIPVEDPGKPFEACPGKIPTDIGQRDIDDEQVKVGEHNADAHDGQHLVRPDRSYRSLWKSIGVW